MIVSSAPAEKIEERERGLRKISILLLHEYYVL